MPMPAAARQALAAERDEKVARLLRSGIEQAAIRERLGISRRSLDAIIARLRALECEAGRTVQEVRR